MPSAQSTPSVDASPPAQPVVFAAGDRVAVLLPLPVDTAYDYLVPEGAVFVPGDIVEVPLARRFEVGVVWGAGLGDIPAAKLREVVHKLDLPALPDVLRKFIDWVSGYTLQPAGAVLRMTLNPARRWPQAKGATAIVSAGKTLAACGVKSTPGREKLLAFAATGGPFESAAALSRDSGVGAGVIRDLITAGALTLIEAAPASPFAQAKADYAKPTLAAAQTEAADHLRARVGAGFSVTLLDGVTGSGKTAVYLEAAAKALRAGQQVLVLVPEIALTTQGLARIEERFGAAPAEWHSDLTYKARRETWHGAATGAAQIVVGARSALFLPFRDLGLIVVDEEHDSAFKQEEGVIYHARDMAVVRARQGNIPIVLASATPSLETTINVRSNRYGMVHLPERFGAATMPRIGVIDLEEASTGERALGPCVACAAAGAMRRSRAGVRRTDVIVPEPARLRAADVVPDLRASLELSALHIVAGGTSPHAQTAMSSLRLQRAFARDLFFLRREGLFCALRSWY